MHGVIIFNEDTNKYHWGLSHTLKEDDVVLISKRSWDLAEDARANAAHWLNKIGIKVNEWEL